MSTRTGRIVSFLFRTVVIIVLLSSAVAIAYWLTMTRTVTKSVDREQTRRSVEVFKAVPEHVARTWIGYGTAEAVDSADVPCELTSIVERIPDDVEVGRAISRGDLIAQLDDQDFRQQQEIAERTLREMATRQEQLDLDETIAREQVELWSQDVQILEDELKRVLSAREKDAATQREVDLVRQRLIQARSSETAARERRDSIPISRQLLDAQMASQRVTRDIASRNVERCRITSPIDGVIEFVGIEVGERVDPMTRVARIVDTSRIVVPIRLPSAARDSISTGDKVVLMATGAIDRIWDGAVVSRVSPVDDASTRTMTVFAESKEPADSESMLFAPGTFLTATVISDQRLPRFVVPRSAVSNGRIWFVGNDSMIDSMEVDVDFPLDSDRSTGRRLVLRNALLEGLLVVIDAGRTPTIGTEVTPVIEDEEATTASDKTP